MKLLISPTTCTVPGNADWIARWTSAVSCETVRTLLGIGAIPNLDKLDDSALTLSDFMDVQVVNSKNCAT